MEAASAHRAGAAASLVSETFHEAGPLGMTFTTASEHTELCLYLGHIQPNSQAASRRSLAAGMRLVQVDDWEVQGASYRDVLSQLAHRPVTLTFTKGGWQDLIVQSSAVIQGLKEEVASTNMCLLHHKGQHEMLVRKRRSVPCPTHILVQALISRGAGATRSPTTCTRCTSTGARSATSTQKRWRQLLVLRLSGTERAI